MHPLLPYAIGGGILLLKKLLEPPDPTPEQIVNCSAAIQEYYATEVRLGRGHKQALARHRDANRTRIREGLKRRKAAMPLEFIAQGSYAMDTIILEANNAYDIDDGVVFDAQDLKGQRGAPLSALDARRLVLECLDDDARIAPELRTNCIRIPYSKGYHVDVPVYRFAMTPRGARLEHAGKEWQAADPRGVTAWFQRSVESKSPDKSDGRQMRRVVRLIKKMFATRSSWNTPSGFILSRLVDEAYVAVPGRDDASLYLTLLHIRRRVTEDLVVTHPVIDRELTRGRKDPRMITLRDALTELLPALTPLSDPTTSQHDALTAWRAAFNDPYITLVRDETTDAPRRDR